MSNNLAGRWAKPLVPNERIEKTQCQVPAKNGAKMSGLGLIFLVYFVWMLTLKLKSMAEEKEREIAFRHRAWQQEVEQEFDKQHSRKSEDGEN